MIDDRYLNIRMEEMRIDFYGFIILILVYEEKSEFLKMAHMSDFMGFTARVKTLEQYGLVKWISENPEDIVMRKVGEELFKKYVGSKKEITTAFEVKKWIELWREIFPLGVNAGGYRYRGDKAEVLKKMVKFVNSNDYSIDQIFKATKDYVERFSQKGYTYMQQAHYFINKQGVGSTLASECEGLVDDKPNEKEGNYGGKVI